MFRHKQKKKSWKARTAEDDSQDFDDQINQGYSYKFYLDECFTFYHENLVFRNFNPERVFIDKIFTESGFMKYLEDRNLDFWAIGLSKIHRKMVLELYGNIFPGITDESSIWFENVYVRRSLVSLSADVINSMLGLSPNTDAGLPHEVVPLSNDEVAEAITNGQVEKSSRGFSLTLLKSHLISLFRLVTYNIFPTANKSTVSIEMVVLLYAIDHDINSVNPGQLVLNKILSFMRGTNLTRDNLPYSALLTALLIKQNHDPEADEIPVKVAPYKPPNVSTDDLNPNNLVGNAFLSHLNREYAETSALQKKYFQLSEVARKRMERIHKRTQVVIRLNIPDVVLDDDGNPVVLSEEEGDGDDAADA